MHYIIARFYDDGRATAEIKTNDDAEAKRENYRAMSKWKNGFYNTLRNCDFYILTVGDNCMYPTIESWISDTLMIIDLSEITALSASLKSGCETDITRFFAGISMKV